MGKLYGLRDISHYPNWCYCCDLIIWHPTAKHKFEAIVPQNIINISSSAVHWNECVPRLSNRLPGNVKKTMLRNRQYNMGYIFLNKQLSYGWYLWLEIISFFNMTSTSCRVYAEQNICYIKSFRWLNVVFFQAMVLDYSSSPSIFICTYVVFSYT
jgi:hypothetical protein